MNPIMIDSTDNPIEPTEEPEGALTAGPEETGESEPAPPPEQAAAEESPDGGRPRTKISQRRGKTEPAEVPASAEGVAAPVPIEPTEPSEATDEEPAPELVWYVLKVQSSREDTIRDALQRRVKIQGLEKYFGKNTDGRPRIVVPTEKITEIRNNKKRIVERKTYPGYIMVQMELNEKTWFLVRETPGVGDFVGAHGTPTKMTEAEVNQMLHQEEEKTTAETPKVRIDVERGDRVKIKDGPFENFEGTVEEVIEGRGLVKVMLIIFNRPTPVDLEYWQLERI
jgi:transcriptional antiterminator NusG